MSKVHVDSMGVELKNLSKVFMHTDRSGSTLAVDNVSLTVNPGELITLLGPSGCGKTTVLRMLAGFTLPTDGKINIGNQEMTNVAPNKRNVGMMFQSYALFPHLTVFENIAYGLRVQRLAEEVVRDKVNAVMEMMHIEEYRTRLPEQLSGGQQQRVALARAIITEPKILLFDEPLSNLDAKMREYMREELRKTQRNLKITSIYVTHDQSEAMAISDRVVIMNKGKIEQIGTPSEIYMQPVNEFVADFMGRATFLPATLQKVTKDRWVIDLFGIPLEINPNLELATTKKGDAISLMVRPEFIRLDKDGLFEGLITRATFFGERMEYEIDIHGTIITMNDSDFLSNGVVKEGETVRVTLDEKGLRALPIAESMV